MRGKMAPSEWIIITAICLILFSLVISFRILVRKRKAVAAAWEKSFPNTMPVEGVDMPVLESYSGLKALAPVTFAQNGIAPKLIFYEDRFEYRVYRKRSALYSEVESLRAYRSRFYNRLQFKFTNSDLFFMVVLTDESILQKIVDFLGVKGIFLDDKSRI
jgi:hypothetical protein